MLSLLWSFSLIILPLLLWQGWRTRRSAVRLPDALPPAQGCFGKGAAGPTILGLGDSVIAGVGVERLDDSLTACVARELSDRAGNEVNWVALGVNGHKLADLLARVKAESLPSADIYLISIGVNDVTGLTSLVRWQMQVVELITTLHGRGLLVLLGVPPMEEFTALPQPLRQMLGIRAALLQKSLRQVGDLMPQVLVLDLNNISSHGYLADDGYHPSGLACLKIAVQIVDALPDQEGEV